MSEQSAVEQLREAELLPEEVEHYARGTEGPREWLADRNPRDAVEMTVRDADAALDALAAVALEQAREARSWQRSSENWAKQRDAEKARREQAETEVERLDFLANHASDLLKLAWEDTESAHMKGGWSFSEWLDYLEADLARRSGGES